MDDANEHSEQTLYRRPPDDVLAILDAPPTPWMLISPDTRWMLLVEHETLPSLADVARPMLRLAGVRIDPETNARHQTSFGTGLLLRDRAGAGLVRVELPSGRRIAAVRWSHDSRRFACTLVGGQGSELWTCALDAPRLQLACARLNAVFGEGFEWMPDGERLLCSVIPAERAAEPPQAAPLPVGPVVQESGGEVSPLRTYQDLLRNADDERLFEHHARAQLVLVDTQHEERHTIGDPGILLAVDPSPDGRHVLVTRALRPFSYSLTVYGFPSCIEVYDSAHGRLEQRFASVPAAENIPIEGVRTGPRAVGWSAHEDATLVWVEALDDGDPRRSVPHRDRWLAAELGATSTPREIVRLEHRASGLSWMRARQRLLAREYDRERRWTRCWMIDHSTTPAVSVLLDDRSVRDHYADPGAILLESTARGRRVVKQHGAWIYRSSEGSTPDGARPFLDRQNLSTLETVRVWRCANGAYESPVAIVADDEGRATQAADASASHAADASANQARGASAIERASNATAPARFITRHESPHEPPNLRLRSFASEEWTALTELADPTPQLRRIKKELLSYEREDGVALSGTLYLPPEHVPGERLPLVLWAYPHDFVDAHTAGQVHGSPHHFTRIGGASQLFFLLRGYAVLDGASMPIIGDPATMNDTFVEQAVASARAAIEKLDQLGLCDPARVGIGGHSYGAFMTVQLLAHCDLFKAGIARSGAYNRTLTPFGFQSERRSLWEARESYLKLSPFLHADRIKAPLLLIHGAQDQNPGTFPMQTERLFHAIKGNGGTARYVLLPHESHAYRARESILHVLAEMFDWFEQHVKRR